MISESTYLNNILEIAIIAHCSFSIIYLSSFRWSRNRWMILIFLVLVFLMLGLQLEPVLGNNTVRFLFDNPALMLLVFPAFYKYVNELIQIDGKKWTAKHFLAFFPLYLYYLVVGSPHPEDFFSSEQPMYQLFVNLGLLMYYFVGAGIYMTYIFRLIRLNKEKYLNVYADNPITVTLEWIVFPLYILGLLSLIVTFSFLFFQLQATNPIPFLMVELFFLVMAFVLSFFCFRQPVLYEEEQNQALEAAKSKPPISKNPSSKKEQEESKSLLNEEEKKVLAQKIERYFETHQPYLNPKIRMPELAGALNISPHVFSSLINEHYQVNFFRFINRYRVNYAKELIRQEAYQHYTLEAISKMSGFNSKTTFNNRFKEMVGMSPSQYRKEGGN